MRPWRLPLVLVFVLVCLLIAAASPSSAAQDAVPPPVLKLREETPQDRLRTLHRFLDEALLGRAQFARALSSLPRDLAATAVEPIYHDYAQAIGAAREATVAALYRVEGDVVTMPALTHSELVAVAEKTSKAFADATAQAARELARAGEMEGRSADDIEADLYRVLVARSFQSLFKGFHDDASPGYDVLIDFDEARSVDAGIANAALSARKDLTAADALDAATAAFRRSGAQLGKEIVGRAGASAIATRLLWTAEPPPEWLTKMLERGRPDRKAWADASQSLAEVIERHLLAGGDARAAARWRLRALAAMSGTAIVVDSWGQAVADIAILFGAARPELEAIRTVMDDASVGRCERAKATLAAYRRWLADLNEQYPGNGAVPPDALLRAHENQMAFEKSVRDRVLASIAPSLLREELAHVVSPELSYRGPRWLQSWQGSQRKDAEAPNAVAPEGGAQ